MKIVRETSTRLLVEWRSGWWGIYGASAMKFEKAHVEALYNVLRNAGAGKWVTIDEDVYRWEGKCVKAVVSSEDVHRNKERQWKIVLHIELGDYIISFRVHPADRDEDVGAASEAIMVVTALLDEAELMRDP